jgi:hypothetical protein
VAAVVVGVVQVVLGLIVTVVPTHLHRVGVGHREGREGVDYRGTQRPEGG